MADTNLAQAVEATHDSSSYDANVKFLLADKQILARILKYAVQEFKDMPIEDIMASIGENIEIGTRPLDAGISNMGRVNASSTEDNVPGEGKIFFDIRFNAYHKEMEMKFLINVEAQKSSEPGKLGYHLENRIIFYLARMISAQKQTELEGRIQTMCNLSENIKEQSIKTERLNAIERMIKADFTKKQIISCGYTEEEFAEAESLLCANV